MKLRSIIEGIQRGVKHVEGSFAVWLYNRDDGNIYLFRNQMPIVITQVSTEKEVIIFASDEEAIREALGAYRSRELKMHQPYPTPVDLVPNLIYVVKPGKIKAIGRVDKTKNTE